MSLLSISQLNLEEALISILIVTQQLLMHNKSEGHVYSSDTTC